MPNVGQILNSERRGFVDMIGMRGEGSPKNHSNIFVVTKPLKPKCFAVYLWSSK